MIFNRKILNFQIKIYLKYKLFKTKKLGNKKKFWPK